MRKKTIMESDYKQFDPLELEYGEVSPSMNEYRNTMFYHSNALRRKPNRQNICSLFNTFSVVAFNRLVDCFGKKNNVYIMQSGRRIKVGALIAEGGFSYVHRVNDLESGEDFALKKVFCQNDEQIQSIKAEMDTHRMFSHPGLLPLLDYSVKEKSNGTEYCLLFPFYKYGTLRTYISKNLSQSVPPKEKEIVGILIKLVEAVNFLHNYSPSMAHHDIKVENVLLSDHLEPVLMDFGSVSQAKMKITNRNEALRLQEWAAKNSSMAYRAPELFDVPSECEISEKTDVWSLGCTMFAIAFGYSPFECVFDQSDNVCFVECTYLRVIGKVPFPKQTLFSAAYCDLIRWMLSIDSTHRPSLQEVLKRLEQMNRSIYKEDNG